MFLQSLNLRTVRRGSRRAIAGLVAGLAILAVLPSSAAAQWRVGGFIGAEHESSWDEFLVIGGDVRGVMASGRFELNPRVSYFLREGTKRIQLDLNFIRGMQVSGIPKLEPYLGVGLALESSSFDSPGVDRETYFGANYVMGGTLQTSGRLQPFAQFQYTVLHDGLNSAVVSIGLHYKLSASMASRMRSVVRR